MFKRLFIVGSLAALLGCQKPDPALSEKLDRVDTKLDALSRKVDALGARAGAQRPQAPPPRGADPSLVYSVPVGDAPVKGPATAKITIVEAAEFA